MLCSGAALFQLGHSLKGWELASPSAGVCLGEQSGFLFLGESKAEEEQTQACPELG